MSIKDGLLYAIREIERKEEQRDSFKGGSNGWRATSQCLVTRLSLPQNKIPKRVIELSGSRRGQSSSERGTAYSDAWG